MAKIKEKENDEPLDKKQPPKNPMIKKYGPGAGMCSQCPFFKTGHKEPMTEAVRLLIDAPKEQAFFPAVDICRLREFKRVSVKSEASGQMSHYEKPTKHKGDFTACRMISTPSNLVEKLVKDKA